MKVAFSFLLCALLCGCASIVRHTPSQSDLRLMWQTQPLPGSSARYASTQSAVQLANRVFSRIQLVGLSRAQVIALLGDPQHSSNSGYNFPFYSAPTGALVYRFDTGAGGWQFNVVFDRDGLVQEVQRRPIV